MRYSGELESWPDHIKKRVKYTIQTIDYSKLPQDLIEEWKRWYKPCGSFRLLTPMLLGETVRHLDPNVDMFKKSFRVKQVLRSMRIPMWSSQNQLMNSGLKWSHLKKAKLWRLLPQQVMLSVDLDSMKTSFNTTLGSFRSILVSKALIFYCTPFIVC